MATEMKQRSLYAPTRDGGGSMMKSPPSVSPTNEWHYASATFAERKWKTRLMSNRKR